MSGPDLFDQIEALWCDCDDQGTWDRRVMVDGAKSEASTYCCANCEAAKGAVMAEWCDGTPVVHPLPRRHEVAS